MTITVTQPIQDYWEVGDTDANRVLGYIQLHTDTGLYEARRPHPGSHKGEISIPVGNFTTLELAVVALQ